MGRNTSDSEWFSMQKKTVTSVEMMHVGKWLCQVKCEWENQTKDGTQMVEEEDDEQLQEMKRLIGRLAVRRVALLQTAWRQSEAPQFVVTITVQQFTA
jgi:hypothetical protein